MHASHAALASAISEYRALLLSKMCDPHPCNSCDAGVPIIVKPADGAKGAPKGARIIAIVPMPTVVHYIIHTGHKEYKVETLPAAR